jgi:hypothetical protein
VSGDYSLAAVVVLIAGAVLGAVLVVVLVLVTVHAVLRAVLVLVAVLILILVLVVVLVTVLIHRKILQNSVLRHAAGVILPEKSGFILWLENQAGQ